MNYISFLIVYHIIYYRPIKLDGRRISPAAEATGGSSIPSDIPSMNEDIDDTFVIETKLKPNATLLEIFEAMKHSVTGLSFLSPVPSLPSMSFVSIDAINWLNNRFESNINALEILEKMRFRKMICHASGDFEKPIVIGFNLYYIAIQDKESVDYSSPLYDLEAFENEWVEVEIVHGDQNVDPNEVDVPLFLRESIATRSFDAPLYKQCHLEIDFGQKSDRTEWGHARYHDVMIPGQAWEIVVQWVTASGPIAFEMVNGWCRKAQQCGFQLISIPADPLAEPFTEKSDPLRGPIFVPLDTDCLKQDRSFLFEEFKKDTWPDRLLLFQEAILARFGFMPCAVETKIGSNQRSFDHQYVHCSGNMFILIPSPHQNLKFRQRLASGSKKKPSFANRYPMEASAAHEAYITRHVSGTKNKEDCDVVRKPGFLWSWNHMIANKKWKSLVINNSQDGELFQIRMLRDFKDFCSNHDQRLSTFWDQCWENKVRYCIRDKI